MNDITDLREYYVQQMLIRFSISNDIFTRDFARYHHLATEEIILLAKAMDFIEDVVR